MNLQGRPPISGYRSQIRSLCDGNRGLLLLPNTCISVQDCRRDTSGLVSLNSAALWSQAARLPSAFPDVQPWPLDRACVVPSQLQPLQRRPGRCFQLAQRP